MRKNGAPVRQDRAAYRRDRQRMTTQSSSAGRSRFVSAAAQKLQMMAMAAPTSSLMSGRGVHDFVGVGNVHAPHIPAGVDMAHFQSLQGVFAACTMVLGIINAGSLWFGLGVLCQQPKGKISLSVFAGAAVPAVNLILASNIAHYVLDAKAPADFNGILGELVCLVPLTILGITLNTPRNIIAASAVVKR